MTPNTLRAALRGLIVVIFTPLSLSADAIVDSSFDDNQNDFGYCWYYYDDNALVGKNDRPQAAPTSVPSVINVPFTNSPRKAFGDSSDTFSIKNYLFTVDNEGSNNYATMPFTFGSTWRVSWGTAYPNVGIGTSLSKVGGSVDLSGTSAIKFKIRSHVSGLTVIFKVQTKEIDDISEVPGNLLKGDEFGYYCIQITVNKTWREVAINIDDLKLPGNFAREIPFNIKKVTKLVWEVSKEVNTSTIVDTIDIDDVVIVNKLIEPPPQGKIIDANFDDSVNNFGYCWYFYDDNRRLGKNDRPQSTTPSTASVINVPYVNSFRHAFGDPDDICLIKNYSFKTDRGILNNYATMPFTLGSPWIASSGLVQPFVGIGTSLAEAGCSIDLTGTTSIKFKIRSHVKSDLLVRFRIQTKEIDDISEIPGALLKGDEFGYYFTSIKVTNSWTEIQVNLAELKLPTFARDIPFNTKSITRIAWEITQDDNSGLITDTLDIDDISLIGFTGSVKPPTPPVSMVPPSSGKFATFEETPYGKSPLNTYWYTFDDSSSGGKSSIAKGLITDFQTDKSTIDWLNNNGSNSSRSLELHAIFGNPIIQDSIQKDGFIGMGCKTYDSSRSQYWDLERLYVNLIYFHYRTIGYTKVTFEIRDRNDVADANNPNRKNIRADVVWHKELPGTNGQWVAVSIPFSSLVLSNNGSTVVNAVPLDRSSIAGIQFKIQGLSEQKGMIAIDNVYFPSLGTLANKYPSLLQNKSLYAYYQDGLFKIKFNSTNTINKGKISIFNARGALVTEYPLSDVSFCAVKIPAKQIQSGMYIIKIDASDVKGKAVMMKAALTIIK